MVDKYRDNNTKNLLIYEEPFQYEQIKRAVELGLGVKGGKEIKILRVE